MKRRGFIAGIGSLWAMSLALGQPGAQQRRIAMLELGDRTTRAEQWRVLLARLGELGYAEGRNLAVERRWADHAEARLATLAQELLAGKPELVLVATTPATQALMRLTKTVPIVMTGAADPVAAGLVASLSHPGGNVTGLSTQLGGVAAKRVDLILELKPAARRIGLLGPAANAGVKSVLKQVQEAARSRGVEVRLLDAADAAAAARAFEVLRADPVDALLVAQIMFAHHREIVALAAQHRIAAAYVDKEIVDAGGLLAFGPDREGPYRQVAEYVHKILQGTKPADLPVMQPTEFWLAVNLRTARALGLKVPQSLLLRADRVIE